MIQLILEETDQKMEDVVAHTKREFSKIRTGRASSAMVENLQVQAYGVEMRVQELVTFSVPEPRQLLVTPHDSNNVSAIERAIMNADLGLTPSNDGRTIRLSFPELTEDRRREMARMVSRMAEDGKNQLRGIRRYARKDLEGIGSEGHISEDDIRFGNTQLDDLTHRNEIVIDAARSNKEDELLEV